MSKQNEAHERPRTPFVAGKSMGDTVHALIGRFFFVSATVVPGAVVASVAVLGGGLLRCHWHSR